MDADGGCTSTPLYNNDGWDPMHKGWLYDFFEFLGVLFWNMIPCKRRWKSPTITILGPPLGIGKMNY